MPSKARPSSGSEHDSKGGTVSVRFLVEEVFDLPQRKLTLAVGQMLAGVVSAGMMLRDEATGAAVTIAGIDLIPPPADNPDRVSLIISPESETRPTRGMVLVAP
jgi:hypothetical protein